MSSPFQREFIWKIFQCIVSMNVTFNILWFLWHHRDSSSDPVKATGTPLREQRKQRRSPSVDLMKTLNQIKQRDKNRRPRASSTEETSSSPLSFRNSPLHIHTSENGETYPRGPAGSRGHPFTMAMESVQTHRAKLSHRSERKESISNLSRMNSLRGSASAHLERLMYQQELFRKEEDTNMVSAPCLVVVVVVVFSFCM